jgi:ATP-dependent Clp protease ATP-binding subunit ClpA
VLEHLVLALIDDVDASAVMKAWKVDLSALKEHLASYIDQRPENARGRTTASPESTIHDRLVRAA